MTASRYLMSAIVYLLTTLNNARQCAGGKLIAAADAGGVEAERMPRHKYK